MKALLGEWKKMNINENIYEHMALHKEAQVPT